MNADGLAAVAGWLAALVAFGAFVLQIWKAKRKEDRDNDSAVLRLAHEVDMNKRLLEEQRKQTDQFMTAYRETVEKMAQDRKEFFEKIEQANKEHRDAIDRLRNSMTTALTNSINAVYSRINELTDAKLKS